MLTESALALDDRRLRDRRGAAASGGDGHANIASSTTRPSCLDVAPACGKFIVACNTPRKCHDRPSKSDPAANSPLAIASRKILLRTARWPMSPFRATP
jgi:hypothetical protein